MTSDRREEHDPELLSRILEQLTEGVCVTDEAGGIVLANPAFEVMLGYAPGELAGQEASVVFIEPPSAGVDRARCSRKDGSTLETAARVTTARNAGQQVQIATLTPTAAPPLAELELPLGETRSRTWLENSPVCTKIVDADYNLRYMSTAGISALNIEQIEEHYGKPYPFSFYPESFKQEMSANLARAWSSGAVVEQEAAVCDVDGNELWFHSTIVPVRDDAGQVEYLIVVSLETTQRKQAEQALMELNRELEQRIRQRTAQLERANQELEGFSHNVSHDLRAPLRNIKSFAQLIERKFAAELSQEAGKLFGFITDGASQMEALLEDLLAYSRLGRGAVSMEPISMDEVFRRAMKSMAAQLEEADARVNMPSSMPRVVGNLNLTVQAVINLLENAIKYRRPEAPLVVDVRHQVDGGQVVLAIADNGLGIAPEHQADIFIPFRRLHRQADIPGTGIGLASVKKAMEIMGGGVEVASEPGQGSTFSITLPAET